MAISSVQTHGHRSQWLAGPGQDAEATVCGPGKEDW